MISVENISKQYNDTLVVDGVSLQLPKGKLISLIGSNAAGKSTLLGIISRIIDPNGGVIIVNDRNIADYRSRALAQRLSILKQTNRLSLKLTVRELVAFGRFPYSQGRLNALDREKIEEAMAFMELGDLKDRFVDELSGGQQQRAFVGMVAAQDTDYILLDEPLNNLDIKHSVQIMGTLRALCEEKGKSIVTVIYDINFASQYSDYIAAMKGGRLIHFGTTREIMDPKKLREIYDMDFEIFEKNDKCFCTYYN